MDIDLTQYVAGGYFIIQSSLRDPDRSPDLLPERIISLSECICPSVLVYWGWETDRFADEAMAFGIPQDRLTELEAWSINAKIDPPNVFDTMEAAQNFATQFLPKLDDLLLLGIALPNKLIDKFLTEDQQYIQKVYDSQAKTAYGLQRKLLDGFSLPPGGNVLGFEILSYYLNQLSHSWLCSGLERDMADQFGIRPNEHGLIATLDEAMQVYGWIAEDEQRGHRAEPEPYYPWLLVEYPLGDSQQSEAEGETRTLD